MRTIRVSEVEVGHSVVLGYEAWGGDFGEEHVHLVLAKWYSPGTGDLCLAVQQRVTDHEFTTCLNPRSSIELVESGDSRRAIVVHITLQVDGEAPDDEIDFVAGTAATQFEEPTDPEGNDYEWHTYSVRVDWHAAGTIRWTENGAVCSCGNTADSPHHGFVTEGKLVHCLACGAFARL